MPRVMCKDSKFSSKLASVAAAPAVAEMRNPVVVSLSGNHLIFIIFLCENVSRVLFYGEDGGTGCPDISILRVSNRNEICYGPARRSSKCALLLITGRNKVAVEIGFT